MAFALGVGARDLQRFVRQFVRVDRFEREALGVRQGQRRRDDRVDLAGALHDLAGPLGGRGVAVELAQQEAGETADRVHGVADLVGDATGHRAEGRHLGLLVQALGDARQLRAVVQDEHVAERLVLVDPHGGRARGDDATRTIGRGALDRGVLRRVRQLREDVHARGIVAQEFTGDAVDLDHVAVRVGHQHTGGERGEHGLQVGIGVIEFLDLDLQLGFHTGRAGRQIPSR